MARELEPLFAVVAVVGLLLLASRLLEGPADASPAPSSEPQYVPQMVTP